MSISFDFGLVEHEIVGFACKSKRARLLSRRIKTSSQKQIGNNRFELVRHDITKEYFAEVDQIYNLACPASPPHYQYDAIKNSTDPADVNTKAYLKRRINMIATSKGFATV